MEVVDATRCPLPLSKGPIQSFVCIELSLDTQGDVSYLNKLYLGTPSQDVLSVFSSGDWHCVFFVSSLKIPKMPHPFVPFLFTF